MLAIKRKLLYISGCLILLSGIGFHAEAAETENAAVATLQQTARDAEFKEEPGKNAVTLAILPKGTAVIVYNERQGSWNRAEYGGIEGYIESNALEQYNAEGIEELNMEFQEVEEETMRVVDEYELKLKAKRSSIIWGAVIAILVAGIFVVGIISAFKKGEEETEEEEEVEE